jgi:hypothetical protein
MSKKILLITNVMADVMIFEFLIKSLSDVVDVTLDHRVDFGDELSELKKSPPSILFLDGGFAWALGSIFDARDFAEARGVKPGKLIGYDTDDNTEFALRVKSMENAQFMLKPLNIAKLKGELVRLAWSE